MRILCHESKMLETERMMEIAAIVTRARLQMFIRHKYHKSLVTVENCGSAR